MIANARKNVQQFALLWLRMTNTIRCQQRQRQFPRNLDRRLIARLFFPAKMPLQLNINIFASKDFAKLHERLRCLA